MLEKTLILELIGKKNFVDRVAYAICNQHRIAITDIQFKLFEHPDYGTQELIVITYSGSAIAVRNVNYNSNSANFCEIANMINGGYYDEVKSYREMLKDPDWVEIDLSLLAKEEN
ncbi:MAG: hypothetical protein KBT06_04410 [Prevotellaceae bacterium]|nr:hypothetical protein [Candidatus Colivivens equi]